MKSNLTFVVLAFLSFSLVSFDTSALESKLDLGVCNPHQESVAACTPDSEASTDVRICLGSHHPRCFETKKGDYVQTLNGMSTNPVKLTGPEQDRIKRAIDTFKSWLSSELSKEKALAVPCTETVAVQTATSKDSLCFGALSGASANLAKMKRNELVALLSTPKSFESAKKSNSRSKTNKRTSK